MTNQDSIAAITDLIGAYVGAMTRGDRAALERIFFEGASEVGHFQGELLWNPREAFIAMCEEYADAAADTSWTIRNISVHGDIAVVHVQNDWAGMPFDDLLTLLLHDGAWRVVSKAYRIRG